MTFVLLTVLDWLLIVLNGVFVYIGLVLGENKIWPINLFVLVFLFMTWLGILVAEVKYR